MITMQSMTILITAVLLTATVIVGKQNQNKMNALMKNKKKYPCSINDAIEVMKILDKVYADEIKPI